MGQAAYGANETIGPHAQALVRPGQGPPKYRNAEQVSRQIATYLAVGSAPQAARKDVRTIVSQERARL
jgi:hypothetical protein